ncbi:thiamine pyrophosphate-dependent enzyme, partial [bacterium]|nr:thiamine pyrophosphate-dependent enzyme [bacterium]
EAQAIRITKEVIKLNCLEECVRADLEAVLEMPQSSQEEIEAVRSQINLIKPMLENLNNESCKELLTVIDFLVKKSVWAFGGDGWAYDIGFGGLDHVMASGRNINILVMDTEVYSNTGGQSSKATPMGATAKFAANGKAMVKKDLGMVAMSYGYVYVAKVALSNPNQVLKAMIEAEKHPGPSIIMAYSHCVAHGIDMAQGIKEQAKAVKTGHWPLYRFNPAEAEKGNNPLKLDSKAPSMPLEEYALGENRYKILAKSNPEMSKRLLDMAQTNINTKFENLSYLAAREGD